ncbi:MAG: dephospho-CoA kinase [Oscillospiraceae bacterium]|nr:dephospho-CoA kinase [Oscillospiraceae bacterium]
MKKGTIVAITGQSGCGKSTLSRYYSSKGYTVIDCDKVAKEVRRLTDCQIRLAEEFGFDIIVEGVIDTKLLSQRAFATPEKLQKLTDITHPFIEKEILDRAQTAFEKGQEYVFVDGAVIIGGIVEKHCDKFIVVVVEFEKQCRRLMMRDDIDYDRAANRILSQTPYSDMLKKADYVINNNTAVENLILQGELVLRQLTKN